MKDEVWKVLDRKVMSIVRLTSLPKHCFLDGESRDHGGDVEDVKGYV